MCDHDCFNCKLPDCLCDGVEDAFSDKYDIEILRERERNEIDSIVTLENETVRTRKRGRPRKTEESKSLRRKATCRKRYQRDRERLLAQSKAYYAEHIKDPAYRERRRQMDRERYIRKKHECT